ncbi:hypothetical protein COV61_04670 [Candidatus Micrarchaeota archaeon CG11_big_fil_rev_8_21_14_0_20_47_5]|nr:MAG: hypothetical protein AUJ17_05875 [Candidatus Micrarchaeota archaeon CG1_02_47_40]PIN82877.1 MAG: hypothetical protein COV61_04670 [Candidatus Micrarchaeota archaeon CG11_big_fil_rev_8_21_14_0_20_47_5]
MQKFEEYFIGALQDAYVDEKRNEIQLYQKNKEWLDFINANLKKDYGITGKIFKRDVYLLRKRSKAFVLKIKEAKTRMNSFGADFVAGLFDSEGSVYLSTKSKIPIIDVTQSEKGLEYLKCAQKILMENGIDSKLNGPYKHKHGKLLQYHLRIYGNKKCGIFFRLIPIYYKNKFEKCSF